MLSGTEKEENVSPDISASAEEGEVKSLETMGEANEIMTTHADKKGPANIKNLYASVISYNILTVTDGAVRMIVLLYANALKFDAVEIALMFSLYELAGVVTNLFGGIAGSKFGLKCTLLTALFLQMLGLGALCLIEPIFGDIASASEEELESLKVNVTVYIIFCQALSGVAKDFMKLTGKSVPKLVSKDGVDGEDKLFRIVAWLTGAKNSLKGVGYFIGSALVGNLGFWQALVILIAFLMFALPPSLLWMEGDLGKSRETVRLNMDIFRKGHNVNTLSLARFFLFGSRDVWFEIATPIFLKLLGWSNELVGAFMAGYIIIYGNLQASTTQLYKRKKVEDANNSMCSRCQSGVPTRTAVPKWSFAAGLEVVIVGIVLYFPFAEDDTVSVTIILVVGLALFAALFAVNSAIHSYLIVSYSNKDKVSMDLGFYYMGNAMGRLVGTVVSGFLYKATVEDYGLSVCLWVSGAFLIGATVAGFFLKEREA